VEAELLEDVHGHAARIGRAPKGFRGAAREGGTRSYQA
jgi:hypothetical protein